MALQLLDFTSGNVDLAITLPGAGSPSSYKCVLADLVFRIGRGFSNLKTLCTGPWAARTPQDKQGFISSTKFASKGSPISDPLALFGTTTPLAVTFTADVGNTIVGTYHAVDDSLGGVAGAAAFGGAFNMESYGALSSTWVTT